MIKKNSEIAATLLMLIVIFVASCSKKGGFSTPTKKLSYQFKALTPSALVTLSVHMAEAVPSESITRRADFL